MSHESFDIDLVRTFVEPIRLNDGRLLALDRADMQALFSADGGRTWEPGGPLLDSRGRPVVGERFTRAYIVNLLRLSSGEVGLKFEVETASSRLVAYYTKSADEGVTWSGATRITPLDTPSNATWLIEASGGRLVLPNEYAYSQAGHGRREKMSVCTAFISVDGGASWQESRDSLWVNEDAGAIQGPGEVPVVAEISEGRLLMFVRTMYQRIAESASEDGGRTWTPLRLNDLVSSNAEVFLIRVPSTGDLLAVWNQASTAEIETGFYRARLTAAVSADGGRNWGSFRTVAISPGQAHIDRIDDHSPPSYLVTPTAVPPEEHMVHDEFHMNRAPRVQLIGDSAYLAYTHRVYMYVNGQLVCEHDGVKLRVLPVKWFYGSESK